MSYRKQPRQRVHVPSAPRPEFPPSAPAPWAPPSNSLPVWLGPQGTLCVGLPSNHGELGTHVELSSEDPSVMGKMLLRILFDRAAAPRARITEPGVPVQAMISAMEKGLAEGRKIIHCTLQADKLDDDEFLD